MHKRQKYAKFRAWIMLWGFAFLCLSKLFADEPPAPVVSSATADTSYIARDSAEILPDTTLSLPDSTGLLWQSSTIEDVLDYTATDSVYVDMKTRVAHLFSEATVKYSGFHLESDYMEVNLPASEVLARPTLDSAGIEVGVPHFEDSKNSFDAKEIKYNFHTKKGIIRDVMTLQEDIYVHGNVVKKYENDVSFIKNARFTSCDLETPHYDLRAFKAKVVPQKVIVLGSAMMFIENVPTPLILPFAAIPNQKKYRSGILFPSFGQTRRAGFFFKGFGAYLNINDYFDLKAEADAYTGGNWEIRADFRYAVRYKFSGALHFGYSWIYQDERGLPHRAHQNGFKIQWSHSQDSKARPNSRFSANVNFTNSSYSKYSGNLSDYLTSSTTSNISYSLDFARKLHLALNGGADYNTYTRALNITLPTVSLSVDQLYPFRRRKAVGKRRWYETISFNYNLLAQNNIRTTDTNFWSRQTLDDMNNGIKQNARLASTVKVFKYMNWTNSFDYSELWYLNNTVKQYDPEQTQLMDIKNKGFKTTRQFSYNTNLSFNVYGIFKFRKGWIKAFRHVMTPSIGFTYRPDFSKPFWGAYATYTDPNGVEHLYSKYANNIYGGPPSGMVGSVNISLKNTFDMKVRNKKDTISGEKKIKLIDNLTVSTSYNMAADSLRWAPVSISARTVLFQRLNVNLGASFDFYKADKDGHRYNEFFWVNNRYKGLRFSRTDLAVSLAWNLNPKAKPKENGQTREKPQTPYYASDLYDPTDIFLQPIDYKAPWNLNIGYNLNYIVTPDLRNGKLSHDVVQTITLSGNVKITDKFDINFGTGFDVQAKKFTITTISFSRDLHCWEMGFYWVPFGYRTEWNFHIRVKSGIFQSLKAQKSKSYIDNYY